MKFIFEYHSRDNRLHSGEIVASDRQHAFTLLKRQGIRPVRMHEASGFFNKLLGKGKRWMLIAGLIIVLFVVVMVLYFNRSALVVVRNELEVKRFELDDARRRMTISDRSQVYGDVTVLKSLSHNAWIAVFRNVGDRFLSLHAVPGMPCNCSEFYKQNKIDIEKSLMTYAERMCKIDNADYEEVKKIKKIVNGMKLELSAYLKDGGSVSQYIQRLEERTKSELQIYARIKQEILNAKDEEEVKKRNSELRKMGLPMVSRDE